jgi:NodT family efflux transporter outer membrane factor (OMF) lipoprotein
MRLPFKLSVFATVLLNACAVGPNFKPPAAPAQASYSKQPLPAQTGKADISGGEAQRFATGADIPGDWWTLFHSPALNEVISEALKRNPSLQGAQAALRQANELTAAQRGSYLPSLQVGYSATRNRNAVGTLSPTLSSGAAVYTLHTAQVNVSYLLDIFGANRRAVESLQAQADYQRYQMEATYLSLTSNVVAAAVQEASLRAQIAATSDIIRSEHEATDILRRQNELGSIAMTDVMAQEAALAATEATLPALQKQLDQQRHLLSALTGRFPGDEPTQTFNLDDLQIPRELPVSLPSALVRQRPDVLSAEAQVHSASAQVGVAIANLLPQITITGTAGGTSTVLHDLLSTGNTFWTAGANLTQTLFAGGALVHRKRAADAALDQAGAQYRAVVLAAFQNVADVLTALQRDAEALDASVRAERAAADSLQTTRRNVELGAMSYLALLNAQQTYQQAVLNLAQARANRYADTAALFQALGGGWWHADAASPAQASIDPRPNP